MHSHEGTQNELKTTPETAITHPLSQAIQHIAESSQRLTQGNNQMNCLNYIINLASNLHRSYIMTNIPDQIGDT